MLSALQHNDSSSADGQSVSAAPLYRPCVHSFSKTLTLSDASAHGGLSVLRRHADQCLPPLVCFLLFMAKFKIRYMFLRLLSA